MRQTSGLIVVGVDGSAGSERALEWALREGALRGCAIEVVTTWPPEPSHAAGATPAVPIDHAVTAREIQDRTIDAVAGRLPDVFAGVSVAREIVEGSARDVLVEASRSADLVVVGSRGLGALIGAVMGSVSSAVVHAAVCPVVVIGGVADTATGHADVAISARC